MSTSVLSSPASLVSAAVLPPDTVWRLSVQQYHEMIRTGILTDDDPVELLDGLLVTKMPKNPAHSTATRMARGVKRFMIAGVAVVERSEPTDCGDSGGSLRSTPASLHLLFLLIS